VCVCLCEREGERERERERLKMIGPCCPVRTDKSTSAVTECREPVRRSLFLPLIKAPLRAAVARVARREGRGGEGRGIVPDAASAADDASQQEEVTDGIDRPGISGVPAADDAQFTISPEPK
jgi:hypothetical protein